MSLGGSTSHMGRHWSASRVAAQCRPHPEARGVASLRPEWVERGGSSTPLKELPVGTAEPGESGTPSAAPAGCGCMEVLRLAQVGGGEISRAGSALGRRGPAALAVSGGGAHAQLLVLPDPGRPGPWCEGPSASGHVMESLAGPASVLSAGEVLPLCTAGNHAPVSDDAGRGGRLLATAAPMCIDGGYAKDHRRVGEN